MGKRETNGRFAGQTIGGDDAHKTAAYHQDQVRKLSRAEEAMGAIAEEAEHQKLQQEGEQLLDNLGRIRGEVEDQLSTQLHRWFKHQGFWPKDWTPHMAKNWPQPVRGDGKVDEETITIPLKEYVALMKMQKLGLIVTEVAETMEAVRNGDLENEVEELADIDVRMHDYKGGFGHTDLTSGFDGESAARGFMKKMLANFQRPFRHGKNF